MSETTFITLLVALYAAVIAGVVWWGWRWRARRLHRLGLADLGWRELRRVQRTAFRGPVPRDPDERERSVHLVREQLVTSRRIARWMVPLAVVLFIVQAVVLALSGLGFLTVLNVITPVLIGFSQFWSIRQLDRRLDALAAPTQDQGRAVGPSSGR